MTSEEATVNEGAEEWAAIIQKHIFNRCMDKRVMLYICYVVLGLYYL